MKINFYNFKENETEKVSYDTSFPRTDFDPIHILGVPSCHVEAEITKIGELLYITMTVKYTALAPCVYTLEELEYHHKDREEFIYAREGNLEEGIDQTEKNGDINLDDAVHAIIVASVPMHLHKRDAKLPSNGEGYRVLTEDEFNEEQREHKSSPFDVLDDLDLDD